MSFFPIGLDPADPLVPLVAWAARALTFFNVLVLLWLGLTVLLTAERRSVGTWLTGGGLLLGGICSIARASAQAAQPPGALAPLDLWWRASWLPFAGASYLWSVVLVWYAGHHRTRSEKQGLIGLSVLGFCVFLLLLDARPIGLTPQRTRPPAEPFSPGWLLAFESGPGDAHLALAAYLAFTLLCVGIGLRALYDPRSPDRFMGELASRRARPWLTATSLVTLGLSLIVGFGATGVMLFKPLVLFDLLGAMALAAQVVLLGQAIVSYEVFTGKTLPRRGLARYWRSALILAAGFGGLMAISLGLPLDQSYRLMLALVIVAVFYALLSWRSFVERERSLDHVRPFVASDRLVDHLLASERADKSQARSQASDPFGALIDGLLGARVAYLCPVGPLASLVGAPLVAPAGTEPPSPEALAALVARIGTSRTLCLPVDRAAYGRAAWVVPLCGERSLIGLLLLGDRRDGSLYAQEEIEIARAAGERLLDARAAGELARRLLLLQRRRLAEDQLLDGRVRRALHDDVLPLLHTALLSLNGHQRDTQAAALLSEAHGQISGLLAALPPALAPNVARLGLLGALQRVADDLGAELDGVTWELSPDAEQAAAELSPLAAEVLFGAAREVIRNAARHARGTGPAMSQPVHLRVAMARVDESLMVRVDDNGVGVRGDASGTTDERSRPGGGQGLMLHGTLLTVIGGSLAVEGAPGHGTRVTLRVPAPG